MIRADDLPGVQVLPGVGPVEQRLEHRHARSGDVLLEPLSVLGADRVVMRERRAVVDERLLNRGLDHLVLGLHRCRGRRLEREREVQARPGVVAVRQVAHEVALDAYPGEGAVRGRGHRFVERLQIAPRGRGLGHVPGGSPVEQEVPDVRDVELLLVVKRPRPRADAQPAVALDELADGAPLRRHVLLAALVADERQAHLVQIPPELSAEEQPQRA